MSQLIITNNEKCNLSYTCIKVCPAKAIKVEDNHAKIIASRCIGCGHCVTVCAQHAISYQTEKELTSELLNSKQKVSALCDPAIAGEFVDISDYRKFVAMIRELGFDYVHEVAFGVDLVAREYKKILDNFQGKYYISTKCPVTVEYVEKYHPELVENLAPLVPPYVAMSKVIEQKYGKEAKTIYITACTSAKKEAKKFRKENINIKAVITFTELRELFNEYNISEKSVKFSDFDPPFGQKGALFPVSHGMLQSVGVLQNLLDNSVLITEGQANFTQALEEFSRAEDLRQHLDLFYCRGCIMGPGTSSAGKKFTRRTHVINYVAKRLENFDVNKWEQEIEEFSDIDFSRKYKANDTRMKHPSEEEINKVLLNMDKPEEEDRIDCGACGYKTCKEFAIAHIQGLTNFEMCYPYTINKLHTYIDKLDAANKKLRKTQNALKNSEENSKAKEQAATEAAKVITTMLNKIRAGVVMVDDNLKVLESNYSFINMLGEDTRIISETIPGLRGADLKSLIPFSKLFETVLHSGEDILNRDINIDESIFNVSVFTIKKNKIVGGIIRDLTAPEVRKEEVINRAKGVIRDNLKTVQQIAFLLGESAAKTEKTLNSIIEAQKLGNGTKELK